MNGKGGAVNIDGYVTLGTERETVYSADTLIRDLDRAGVDMAVIAPEDRYIAVLNRDGNDIILAAAQQYPDRLIPACTVNPWYGDNAVTELRRVVDAGCRMLVLHPTIQGYLINDELVRPLLEWLTNHALPVYVHTGPHLYGGPWQLTDAALTFPDINFIMGHAGATDFWNDVTNATKAAENIYIDGSFARPFAFVSHLDQVGPERGIMSSAAPRNPLVFEWEQYRQYLAHEKYRPVFGENCARILGLKGGT